MLRFTLRQLEYFVAVGESGSIAVASEKVNVSSPSISAAISQLEDEFGLPLFARQHAKGLSLTLAGRQMMEKAKRVLSEAESMVDLAGDISGKIQGPLAVGCMLTFAQVVLPSLRSSFERNFPDVRFRQYELDQVAIFTNLRRAELDVALTYDLDVPSDLNFQELASLPPYAMFGENHTLAGERSVSIEQLAPHPMALLDLPFSADYFQSFFVKAGVKPQIKERTRDMAVLRSLVANGYGYSIANVRPLNARSPDGKPLHFVPIIGDVRPMKMGILTTPEAENVNVIRAFVQHCKVECTRDALIGLHTIAD